MKRKPSPPRLAEKADAGSTESLEGRAFRVAQLRYEAHMSQRAIARELGTSAASVSRLLHLAHQRGYCQIVFTPPPEARLGLELERVLKPFGIRRVVVAGGEGRGLVGLTAARYFEAHAPPECTIVLDGGWTVRDFVKALAPQARRLVHIIPIAADPPSYEVSAFELMTLCAARCFKQHVWKMPHLVNQRQKSAALQEMRERVQHQARQADFVMLGIGPCRSGFTALDFVRHLGYDTEDFKRQYPQIEAMCGYFPLHTDGALHKQAYRDLDQWIPHALEFNELRSLAKDDARHVVVLASSKIKFDPLVTTLQARLCNTLILDPELAQSLLQRGIP